MNVQKENVCRLCFNEVNNQFEEINKITMEIFDVLLLNVNLDVTKNSVICYNCIEQTLKSFHFKSLCVDTEKIIFSFGVDKPLDQINLKDIYNLRESNGIDATEYEDFSICRFCLRQLKSTFIPMDCIMNDARLVEVLPLFMPELDFTISKNPIICISCRENLECYYNFVQNCLYAKQRLKSYYKNDNITKKTEIVYEEVCDELKEIREDEVNNEDDIIIEELSHMSPLENGEHRYKCTECAHETKHKSALKKHILSHRNRSEVEMYKCATCSFETKYKTGIKSHVRIHKPPSEIKMYRCGICYFETRYKAHLKNHMLIHKNMSEVEIYKCTACTFETKYKYSFRRHLIGHKEASAVEMYKCTSCSYETKLRRKLKYHLKRHKDPSKVKMYKCTFCDYETKHKNYLKTHIMTHKDASEVEMFKCTSCAYATKYKRYIKTHMLTHKDCSEVEMHKCASCMYQTKYKNNLAKHMRTMHK